MYASRKKGSCTGLTTIIQIFFACIHSVKYRTQVSSCSPTWWSLLFLVLPESILKLKKTVSRHFRRGKFPISNYAKCVPLQTGFFSSLSLTRKTYPFRHPVLLVYLKLGFVFILVCFCSVTCKMFCQRKKGFVETW